MQAELFETSRSVGEAARVNKVQTSWLNQFSMTLRIDHLLIAGILALVLYVLVFSFGVEKGKRYASAELKAMQVKQDPLTAPPADETPIHSDSSQAQELPLSPSKTSEPRQVPTVAAAETSQKAQSASPPGRYTIQLITFTSRPRAEEQVERLKKQGYQSFIIPQGKFFQVCAEAFETVKDARAKLNQLQSEGFAPSDAYIRPLKGLVGV